MKIGRFEIILSSLQKIISIVLSLVTIALVVSQIDDEEYAVWSVFLSIQAFVVLLDSGFGGVVVRYASYAVSGAKHIPVTGTPEMDEERKTNFPLLFNVYFCARKIYQKFSVIGFGILLVATSYIVFLTRNSGNTVYTVISWLLFSVAVAVDMYYTYLSNMMKGMGMLKQSLSIGIWVSIVSFAVKLILIISGLGLLGLSIAYFFQIVFQRLLISIALRKLFASHKDIMTKGKKNIQQYKNSKTYQAIMQNSKQLTFETVSDFLKGKGKTLLCSAFLPLSVTAMFSITSQMIGLIYDVASLPYSTFRYKFGETVPTGNVEESKNVFSMITSLLVAIMAVGTLGCTLFGDWALALIHSSTQMLSAGCVVLIGLYQTINGIIKNCTVYIQYKNIQPYVKAVTIASIGGVILAIPVMWLGGGIAGYLCAIIAVQLVYNAWKWPLFVHRDLKLSIRELCTRCIRYTIRAIKGKV